MITGGINMNELRKYCLGSKVKSFFGTIGLTVLFFGFYVFGFVMLDNMNLAESPKDRNALILAVVLIFLLVLLYRNIFIKPKRFFNKRIEYFIKNNVLELVLNDFSQGVKKCGGDVILGYNCMIARNCGYIFFYSEIQKAYIDTVTTTDTDSDTGATTTDTTDYFAVDVNGKRYHMCEYRGRRNEWAEIKTFLTLKNPNIQVR